MTDAMPPDVIESTPALAMRIMSQTSSGAVVGGGGSMLISLGAGDGR